MSRRAVLEKRCQQYVGGSVAVTRISLTMVRRAEVRSDGVSLEDLLHHHTPEQLLLLAEEDPEEALDCVMELLSTIGMTAPVVVERPRRRKNKPNKSPKKKKT